MKKTATQPSSGQPSEAGLTVLSPAEQSQASASFQADHGPFARERWLSESLPLLEGIGPLLPGKANKSPTVGEGWEMHPGMTVTRLQVLAPKCICWHVGAADDRVAVDIDGAVPAAFCQSHGCDPYTADTWRIERTVNTERLKLVFTVTAEQKAILAAGHKSVKFDGKELALFAKPGHQIVVLGQHYTKESNYTENDDQYAWAGRAPADAQPLPPEWFALLTGVFCGDQPLRPPTCRAVSTSSTNSTGNGGWSNSGQRYPCPVCGRDHSGACSIHHDGCSVWCCHGETRSAPDCSKAGETVHGNDGRIWAYIRTEEHDSFGERSLFVLDKPRQQQEQQAAAEAVAAPPQQGQAEGQRQQAAEAPRRGLTPQEKLSAMRCLAGELLEQQTPFPDRLPLLRARAEALELTLRDQELQRLLWDARRAAAGTIEPLGTGEVIDLAPCPWHWEGVLMADCLNLIAGLPKTGKTSLLLALIGAWRRGEPSFLGLPLIGPCPPVLIVGTDQPASDWGRMMREVGLLSERNEILDPIVALFNKGRPLHLDYEGIERIGTYAAKHPGLLILLDSISACTSSLGLDENSAEIVEPINDLQEAVSPHGATVVAIHHASKGRQGESATLASRGSTALPAAASQMVALGRMPSPLAGPPDPRVVLKTEGRGGMPQQLLIERTEGGWISHGSAEVVAQAQALKEAEEKLSDRQGEALEAVRERWSTTGERTDARSIAMVLRLPGDGGRKVRSTLDQLVRRGLLQSAVETDQQGRTKWFWPVGAEASRGGLSDASEPSEPSYLPSRARTCLDPDFLEDPFPDKGSEGKEGMEGQENTPCETLSSPADGLPVTVDGESGWWLLGGRVPESGNVMAIDPDGTSHHIAVVSVTH